MPLLNIHLRFIFAYHLHICATVVLCCNEELTVSSREMLHTGTNPNGYTLENERPERH